ncbi:WecB/TagA/CpsF family glycosyltransferase [Cellulophaga sp. L1A9]|uniref:WecB/TagA/CpsF family glycosyltransferase n=1 Tax=Cellulophaga sp. L1A9 TaxID=2686362 RepID=UPI00131B1155|nr:WecB/TagA/CpsF family glycosyltransferase [Cellulophaga sp. L1A9]
MNTFSTTSCLGYRVFTDHLDHLPKTKNTVINTINQYSYCMAKKDALFKKTLHASDVLLPDGIGITFAAKFLYGKKIKKIAGADLHAYFLNSLEKKGGSCFYLGASPETLEKIKIKMQQEYPNIKVGAYSPPFKKTFSTVDNAQMITAVNNFNPDVLFIGMTAPKQEKWSFDHKDALNTGYICAIGAVFDFYAGTVARPSEVWQKLGLEWLGRLIKEPRRMWTRYVTHGFIYLGYLLQAKLKGPELETEAKNAPKTETKAKIKTAIEIEVEN